MFVLTEENKDRFEDFYRHEDTDKVWFLQEIDTCGPIYFSFDKRTVYNLFEDYPDKLTPKEKAIFDKENPMLRDLKS